MPSNSINIGISQQGKHLVEKIDLHFKNHELSYHRDHLLTSVIEMRNDIQKLSVLKEDDYFTSKNDLKEWFDDELYGQFKRLGEHLNSIDVNIILSLYDNDSTSQLNSFLEAYDKLSGQISEVNIRLFIILYDIEGANSNHDLIIPKEFNSLEIIIQRFNPIIKDIYYIDDRNIQQVKLNLNINSLAFALGEFIIFQMTMQDGSGALLNKKKAFGVGAIHFNDILFKEVIANTILQFKFEEEGVLEEDTSEDGKVELRDVYSICNSFINEHQNFFSNFLNCYPNSKENNDNLTKNTEAYIEKFQKSFQKFISDEKNNISKSKAILANLLGEDDAKLKGIDWGGIRLNISDLEHDIINYFNKYLENDEKVDFNEQKKLRGKLTNYTQEIKKDKSRLLTLKDQAKEIRRNLDVSYDDGIFSIGGKRINATGYIPSPVNSKDNFYTFPTKKVIPTSIDLSSYFPIVKDQGQLANSTAFPVSSVYEYYAKRNHKTIDISELFIYYNTRDLLGKAGEIVGVSLFDTIEAVKKKGACSTKNHPYDIDSITTKPSEEAYTEGQQQLVKRADRVNIDEEDFKQALSDGHPVIIGLKIFESFYPKNDSGIVSFPKAEEEQLNNYSNHALLIVGYNEDQKLFKLRNSWGIDFGDNGYCYAPYDYIANSDYCLEAFVITDIVDLHFDELVPKKIANLSFIKEKTLRNINIYEFNLRKKERESYEIKKKHDKLAFQNEINTVNIKDSIFRKKLLLRINSQEKKTSSIHIKRNYKTSPLLIVAGLALAALAIILPIPQWIMITLLVVGILAIISGLHYIYKSLSYKTETVTSNIGFSENDRYAFEAAGMLFDVFDKLNQQLIQRYKAISIYYLKVKRWKIESKKTLAQIEYSSPGFLINVIKKDALLNYIEEQKKTFLRNLPLLSNTFHLKYNPIENNIDDLFDNFKKEYFNNIDINIDNILNISIVDYIQGATYPYLDPAPPLNIMMNDIQNNSVPFCNIKQPTQPISIQNYVVHEQIQNNERAKLDRFQQHRTANNRPILIFRGNNKKKYVIVQIATFKNIEEIAKYNKTIDTNTIDGID